MKVVALAAALALTAPAVYAGEIGATGITWGVETTAEYNIDVETFSVVSTPELGYSLAGFDMAVSADINIYSDAFVLGDTKPTLELSVEREIMTNLTAYVETTYDLETSTRGDAIVGMSFTF